jgi:hypothetical protein
MEPGLFESIKKYVNGNLSPEEKQLFENRLASDPAFRDEVKEYMRLFELIQQAGDAQLDSELTQLGKRLLVQETSPGPSHQGRPRQSKKVFSIPNRVWLIAAALIALLIVLIPVWRSQSSEFPEKASPEQLYSSNFRILSAPALRDSEEIHPWKEAYLAGDYPEAIRLLEELLSQPDYAYRSEAFLYLGLCHMAMDQPRDALQALMQVSPDSFDHDHALWYRALAHLKVEEVQKAQDLLEKITASPGSEYEEQARQLLRQL